MTDLIDEMKHYREMGATYAEIADQMGMTRNMVAGYLHRAHAPKSGPRVGEKHPFSKLNASDVLKVREMLSGGLSYRKIARQFHVSPWCIQQIKHGVTWKHVLPDENDDG